MNILVIEIFIKLFFLTGITVLNKITSLLAKHRFQTDTFFSIFRLILSHLAML